MRKALGCLLLLASCGTGVEYTLGCREVDCPGAEDPDVFRTSGYESVTCVWHCATYNGERGRYVSPTFVSIDGACLELDTEYVAEGICG